MYVLVCVCVCYVYVLVCVCVLEWVCVPTHLGVCTRQPHGAPSLWRGRRRAGVPTGPGQRPWGSRWSCRTSGWARGSRPCRPTSPCSAAPSRAVPWWASSTAGVPSHPSRAHAVLACRRALAANPLRPRRPDPRPTAEHDSFYAGSSPDAGTALASSTWGREREREKKKACEIAVR